MHKQLEQRFPRKPWNARVIVGAKPPLKPKHIWALRTHRAGISTGGVVKSTSYEPLQVCRRP